MNGNNTQENNQENRLVNPNTPEIFEQDPKNKKKDITDKGEIQPIKFCH